MAGAGATHVEGAVPLDAGAPGGVGAAEAIAQRRRLGRWAGAAVVVSLLSLAAILVWFQARRDADVLGTFRALDLRVLPLALGLHMAAHAVWATRITLLARGLGVFVRPLAAWRLVTAGQFGAAVTPGRFGAEAMRITLLVRGGAGGSGASRVVLADRASDMVFFVTVGALAAAFLTTVFGASAVAIRGLAFVAVFGLLGFLLLLAAALAWPRTIGRAVEGTAAGLLRFVGRPRPALAHRVAAFVGGVRDGVFGLVRASPGRAAAGFVLSLLLWATEFSVLWVLLRAFGVEVAYVTVFAAGVLITMLAAVPISPGGSGVAEFAAVVLFEPFAGPSAAAFVLVWRALTYYYDLAAGAAVAAWSFPRRDLGIAAPAARP